MVDLVDHWGHDKKGDEEGYAGKHLVRRRVLQPEATSREAEDDEDPGEAREQDQDRRGDGQDRQLRR